MTRRSRIFWLLFPFRVESEFLWPPLTPPASMTLLFLVSFSHDTKLASYNSS
eukprot:m.317324 g.317324  ORF g.317324 m.317324 type:complete len:52 (-) comp55471_c0_seq17:56-211(-)